MKGADGAVITTTLLGKMLTLALNKFLLLDQEGMGIEMEGAHQIHQIIPVIAPVALAKASLQPFVSKPQKPAYKCAAVPADQAVFRDCRTYLPWGKRLPQQFKQRFCLPGYAVSDKLLCLLGCLGRNGKGTGADRLPVLRQRGPGAAEVGNLRAEQRESKAVRIKLKKLHTLKSPISGWKNTSLLRFWHTSRKFPLPWE